MAKEVRKSLAYMRLVTKLTKENLWLYILKMLLERPMYAYEISKEITERFGFSTATVTVYVVLYKMQREGFIQVKLETSVTGRPDRKYYEITGRGREIFLKGKMFLGEVARKLE